MHFSKKFPIILALLVGLFAHCKTGNIESPETEPDPVPPPAVNTNHQSVNVYVNPASSPVLPGPVVNNDASIKSLPLRSLKHNEDQVLVRLKPNTKIKSLNAIKMVSSKVVHSFKKIADVHSLEVQSPLSVKDTIENLSSIPEVDLVEPNYIYYAEEIPNDALFNELWGFHNIGQEGGQVDADINMPEAWGHTGSKEVIIGVIDTGVDYRHEDLVANMWVNPGEIPGNGLDDDGNGYIDDIHGIDAISNTGDPMDFNGHGTHVAGTIAASINNTKGVVGVGVNTKIIACRFLDDNGSGSLSDALKCLEYFHTLKTVYNINILATNNSWGGGGFSEIMQQAIELHKQDGMLFFAAAGNDGTNNDLTPHYPSNYPVSNVIAVAASNRSEGLAYFSNYGFRSVHVVAPGEEIFSTVPGDRYQSLSGTSMATPLVAGLAGLLGSQDKNHSWEEIKNLILTGGTPIEGYANKTLTGRRIRAWDSNGSGSLSCSDQRVLKWVNPGVGQSLYLGTGDSLPLKMLHLNCSEVGGEISILVEPGNQTITLSAEEGSGDGEYSGVWTGANQAGLYTLTPEGGETIQVQVTGNYQNPVEVVQQYREFAGTRLDSLTDDEMAGVRVPFPIYFSGREADYTDLYISANGAITFEYRSIPWQNRNIPVETLSTLVLKS